MIAQKDGSKLVSKIDKAANFRAITKLKLVSVSAYRIRHISYSLVSALILKLKGIGVTLHLVSAVLADFG
jgi:hypothetical protein